MISIGSSPFGYEVWVEGVGLWFNTWAELSTFLMSVVE